MHAHARGLGWALLTLVGLLLAMWAIDWALDLPPSGRIVLLLLALAGLGSVLYQRWWRRLKRYEPRRVALQIESAYPQLRSSLISYVQLAENGDDRASPLIALTRRHAVEAAGEVDFYRIVRFAELRRLMLSAIAAIGVLVILTLVWPTTFRIFTHRLFLPLSTVQYPTRTQLAEVSGDQMLPQGATFALHATAAGLIPQQGQLDVRPIGDEHWQAIDLPRIGDNRFAHTFAAADQSFEFRFRIGDARGQTHRITVVGPPRQTQADIQLHYPAYLDRKDQIRHRLNLQTPVGTSVTWTLHFDQPLAKLVLHRTMQPTVGAVLPASSLDADPIAPDAPEGHAPTPTTPRADAPPPLTMKLSADGRVATLALEADRSFIYTLQATLPREKGGFVFDDPVHHQLTVQPDQPPQVRLVAPLENQPATLHKQLTLQFEGSDDHALDQAWIVYQLNDDQRSHRLPLKRYETERVKDEVIWIPRTTIDGLKVGDVIHYSLAVADNRPAENGGPQEAQSRQLDLTVMSDADYLAAMRQLRAQPIGSVDAAHQQEQSASDSVNAIEKVYGKKDK